MVGGVPGGVPGGAAGGVIGGIIGSVPSAAPPPPPPVRSPKPDAAAHPSRRQRAAGEADPPAEAAVYPPLAKQARIQGVVQFDARSSARTARFRICKLVSGHPLLVPAAHGSGEAVGVSADAAERRAGGSGHQIDVNFTLSQ